MSRRYAYTMLLFMTCIFFSFLSPILLVIGTFGAGYQFWIEKYVLLRRHKVPEVVGPQIAKFFSNLIPWAVLIWSTGVMGFTLTLSGGSNLLGLIAFFIALTFIFVPIRSILLYLMPEVKKESGEEFLYKNQKFNFLHDYDRQNPMTRDEARVEFLKAYSE